MKTIIDQLQEEANEQYKIASEIFLRAGDNAENVNTEEFEQADYSEAYANGLERAIFLMKDQNEYVTLPRDSLIRGLRTLAHMVQEYTSRFDEAEEKSAREYGDVDPSVFEEMVWYERVSDHVEAEFCRFMELIGMDRDDPEICGIQAWVAVVDETKDWIIPKNYKKYIKRIESVYTYDRNLIVHACELAESREFHHVQTRVIFKKNRDDSDPKFEEIHDWAQEAEASQVIYIHRREADFLARKFISIDPKFVDCDRDDQWEWVMEYVRGNEVI